ncbi:MAG: hypothetical protein EOO52_13385 [Gammaproteobacteria bacterium]|nr:MAG: hypothetical protein EOO52_13385 [Gammaproteobacteria bacterium]
MQFLSKEAYNAFANHFRIEFELATQIAIKPSKTRELLARAAGFKSHNNLISSLPVSAELWRQDEVSTSLDESIRSAHGVTAVTKPLLTQAILKIESTIAASTSFLKEIKSGGTFKPASRQDFLTVANSLESLLSLPSQDAKLILAQIYGHASVDDVYAAIASTSPAGPYDVHGYQRAYDNHVKLAYDIGGELRENRILTVIAGFLRKEPSQLPKQAWSIRNLHVYDPVELHLAAYETLSKTYEILDGTYDGRANTLDDYAYVEADLDDGQMQMCLTKLGRSVLDAAAEITADLKRSDGEWHEIVHSVESRLSKLADEHPENPWPKAVYVTTLSNYFWQTEWSNNLEMSATLNAGLEPDSNPLYKQLTYQFADMFTTVAQQALQQFYALLNNNKDKVGDHRSSTANNCEPFYYPALLFYAGITFLNSRDYESAYEYLSLHYKIVKGDNFGARYYLAVLALLRAKGTIKSFFKYPDKEYVDCWGALCLAIHSYKEGLTLEAKKYFSEAIKQNFGACEVFSSPLKDRKIVKIMDSSNAPAAMQHLYFLLTTFWEENPNVLAFFKRLSTSLPVTRALSSYHIAKSNKVGLGLIASTSERLRLEQAFETANTALDIATHKYWQ